MKSIIAGLFLVMGFFIIQVDQLTAEKLDPTSPYFVGMSYLMLIMAIGVLIRALFNLSKTYRNDMKELIGGFKHDNEKYINKFIETNDKMVTALDKLSDKIDKN